MLIRRIDNREIQLVIELFDQYRVFYQQSSDIGLAKTFIEERLNNNESVIFVAFDIDSNIPIAFTQLYPKYSSVRAVKNWILNDLYVRPEDRKKGIGEELINKAMLFAKEDGAVFVQLETAIDNFIAQSLYERIGFVKQEADHEFFLYKINL